MTAYLGLKEDIRYRDGSDLLGRYHAAVETDEAIVDMSEPRMFWGPTEADFNNLRSAIKKLSREVIQRAPIGDLMYIDSPVPYVTYPH